MNDALPPGTSPLRSIDAVEQGLSEAGYIASRQISTAIYIAHHLQKPILVEGPAGVGKTELAKSVASWLKLPLIRMQCYEGLDESKALYEWKYGKQLAVHPDPEGQDQLRDRRPRRSDDGAGQAAFVRRHLLLATVPGTAAAAAVACRHRADRCC